MGYTGSAAGLLDPQTNMTYAVRYLAGALSRRRRQ
jgi:soluble lytic murein transglycosylase-like protein